MLKRKFYAVCTSGKVHFKDRPQFEKHIANFKDGDEVEITVGKRYKRRTQGAPGEATNFNGYYWAVIVRMISDEMGEVDDDATHFLLQMLFNKRGITVTDPETMKQRNVEIPIGTRNMSGGEFADYCSRIRTWASIPGNICEHGFYIPEPNEAEWETP